MITGCVKGQYLSIASPLIVTDSINYLSARFYFSEDWDNAEKWAHFKLSGSETVYDIKLNNDEIPADEGLNLTTGDWEIYLHGTLDGKRITTNSATINVKNTGTIDGEPFPKIPVSVAEQLWAAIGDTSGLRTEEKNNLVSAINEVFASQNNGADVSPERIATIVEQCLKEKPIPELDPTVPGWAKAPEKPTYTAQEVGALPDTTAIPTVPSNISAFNNDANYVTGVEVDEKIKDAGSGFIAQETDPTVPAWAKASEKPTYSADEVGADSKGAASAAVSSHNVDKDSHSDIRLLIEDLTRRFNALADSDDIDLDQLSEIIAVIQNNRELIDSVTTAKINYTDIVDNVTTNANNKPLSAAQGVFLKRLIDAITVPTKLLELADDANHRTVTDTEKAAWDNKSDFDGDYNSLTNRPAIPTVPDAVSAFDNDAGYIAISKNTFASGDTLNIASGYSEYRASAAVSSLVVTYPTGNFEAWIKFATTASGDVSVTFPDNSTFINEAPAFSNAETWELSIKDGVVIAAKCG